MSKEIDEHVLRIYEARKLLGSGAYGHVWKVVQRRSGRPFALKKIFDAFQNATDAQRTYREITILAQLDHPNVVRVERVLRARNNRDLYVAFEFMEADLHSLVGEGVLQGVHLRFIGYQVLRAVRYLHSGQLLHRDLKPSNVLINADCEVKLCDFGLARTLTCEEAKEVVLTEEVATRWYRSPEMLLGSRSYSKPTDLWSVGCILAELLIGRPLFAGDSTLHQLERILEFTGAPSPQEIAALDSEHADSLISQVRVKRRPAREYFGEADPELVGLVMRMLQFDPRRRITVQEALQAGCFREWAHKEEGPVDCGKFLAPSVDDNVKLTVQQYRQILYQDIDRRYPEDGLRNARHHHSFKTRKNTPDPRPHTAKDQLKRQNSMIQVRPHTAHSQPPVRKPEGSPQRAKPKDHREHREHKGEGRREPKDEAKGLKKTVSRATLVKKGGGAPKFKK